MAHKLNDKVLHPQSIEKTNVGLADATFHESRMHALNYYAKNGYQHFEDTVDWSNALNVKSVDYGMKTCDERRKRIRWEYNSEQLSFLCSMACWFEKWQRDYGSSSGLTNPAFKAVIWMANGIPLMAEYLFETQLYLS